LFGAEQSIAEIGAAVGFARHIHFTDAFRKLTSPMSSRFRMDRS
jgi:AraC-like DNA-binding protein